MSNTDSFLEEVAEEVRRDRLFALLRKYGWIGIVLVLAIVAGTAYFEFQGAAEKRKSEALGDRVLSVLETDDAVARIDGLSEIASEGGDAAAVMQFGRAGLLAEEGDIEGAIAAYDAASAALGNTQALAEMAQLKAVLVGASVLSIEERRARLEPLSAPGRPFWLHAQEQQALIHLEKGETEAGLTLLEGIFVDSAVPQGMEQRVAQMIIALGGTLPAETELLSSQ